MTWWAQPKGISIRLDMLAESMVTEIHNRALKAYAQVPKVKALIKFWQWGGEDDFRTCDYCKPQLRKGKPFGIGRIYKPGQFMPIFPAHPSCLKPESLVHTLRGLIPIKDIVLGDMVLTHKGRYRPVIQLHKNKFEGKLYSINGNWMTGNHPVLTRKGWVRADLLNSSKDNVFHFSSTMFKVDENPTLVNKKIRFPLITNYMFGGAMPITTFDFNSDFVFWDSEVNIKNIDGILGDDFDSSFFEGFEKQFFKWRKPSFSLNTSSPFNKPFIGEGFSSSCIMCGFDLPLSLFHSHLTPFQLFSFTSPSAFNTHSFQSVVNGTSITIEPLSKFINGPPFMIKSDDFINRQFNSKLNHLTTSTLTNIDKEQYDGFVYNLSVYEDESYIIGNRGLVIHNCRCFWILRMK